MPSLHRILAACAVLTSALLAGCGGDGAGATGGTPTGSSGGGSSAGSLQITVSSPTVPSDGQTPVTVNVFVKDGSNRALPNQQVDFATADGGVTLQVASAGRTDENGTATATLKNTDPSNRSLTISAASGTLRTAVNINVVGTTMTLSGPTSVVLNAASSFSVSLRDSAGKALAGRVVNVSSSAGNTLSAQAVTTDSAGQAKFTYTASKGSADTISVSGLGASASQAVSVAATQLTFVRPATSQELVVGAGHAVEVRFLQNGQPSSGQAVEFLTTRGSFVGSSTATTDATGTATVTITSPTAGLSTITARVGSLFASQRVEFVSQTPAKLALQASPANVGVNLSGSSGNSSSLIAVVRDAADNPVKGQTVSFSAVSDPSNGRIEPAIAVTDGSGVATVAFYPGANSTGNNAIQVEASVPGTQVKGGTTLTASKQELVVRIGTGNTLSAKDAATYSMPWTAIVTDASGNPVVNATVQAALVGTGFRKGGYCWNGTSHVPAGETCSAPPLSCTSEDSNGNLRLDAGEDRNGDGMLTPGNVATTRVTSADGKTDATGFASITIDYPKEYGNWAEVELRVTITAIGGTEGSSNRRFVLRVLSEDVSDEQKAPPGILSSDRGVISPFGWRADCSVKE